MPTATHPGTRRGRRSVALLAALLLALALALVAGCGSGEDQASPGAGASPSGAADFVPASAPIYVEFSTDVDGPQWTQVFALADRFPALQGLRQMLAQVGDDRVNFERDIKPLLGERAGFAVLELPTDSLAGAARPTVTATAPFDDLEPPDSASDERFLAVAEIADGKEETVRAFIAMEAGTPVANHQGVEVYALDDDGFIAISDGAVLIASSQADLTGAIDAHEAGGDSVLSGVERYQSTLSNLPADTILQAYVDIGRVGSALAQSIPQLSQAGDLGIPEEGAAAVALSAEEQGLRLKGVVTGVPNVDQATEFTPELTSRAPGDAIAYVGLSNLSGQIATILEAVRAGASAEQGQQLQTLLDQLPAMLGVSADDLSALASQEHALVVTPGTTAPGLALILEQADGARAQRTLDALRESVPALLARFGATASTPPPWQPAALENGVNGWFLPIEDDNGVVYGVDGDLAIVGSSIETVRRVQTPVSPLSESPAFIAATAGMPEQVTAVAWIDIAGAVRLGEAMGAFDGEDQTLENLRPLRSVAAWASVDGEVATFEALLTIRTP